VDGLLNLQIGHHLPQFPTIDNEISHDRLFLFRRWWALQEVHRSRRYAGLAGTAVTATTIDAKPATTGRTSWTAAEYWAELSAATLKLAGAQVAANLVSIEYDLSKYVRSGAIVVRG